MDATHTKPTRLNGNSIDELIVLVERFELTLEYIAAAADAHSSDELIGRRFAGIRDTAQEMINEYRAAGRHIDCGLTTTRTQFDF